MKHVFYSFVLVGILVAGCNSPDTSQPGVLSGDKKDRYEQQLDKSDEQAKRYDQQLKQMEEQGKRFDMLLGKWEEQARRYDAVLKRWEQSPSKSK